MQQHAGGDDNELKYQQHHRNDQMELCERVLIIFYNNPKGISTKYLLTSSGSAHAGRPKLYENCKSKSHRGAYNTSSLENQRWH